MLSWNNFRQFGLRKKKKSVKPKLVMAFGTFDSIHAGSESYLQQAKALGDVLLVVVAKDETVRVLKGEYPQKTERQRVAALRKSGLVDKVVLGDLNDKHKVILKYRPDIVALGFNQFVFTQRLEKVLIDAKLNTEVIRLDPYFNNIHRSSLLKKINHENKTATSQIKA